MPRFRVVVWSSIPTHHQSAFFAALRARDIDLVVLYFLRVPRERTELGWAAHPTLPEGERYVPDSLRALEGCPDWNERIHVVPGYGKLLLLKLAWLLSRHRTPWLHWGEHSEPRARSRVTGLVKRGYGQLVNHRSIGALAIGELARREIMGWGVDDAKIRFLPYSVSGFPEAVDPETRPRDAHVRFLFLGQLIPRKGIDILLAAMQIVHARFPLAELELAGNDPSRGLYARQAQALGLGGVARFTGPVPALEVGSVLARCDVLVLPARHDGWGVVLNEAASAGKAIIASETTGAAWHLVVPDMNGFRVPSQDATSLAAAMLRYCTDPGLARDHGIASRQLFEEFTPARNAARFENALESLTERVASAVGSATKPASPHLG